MSDKVDIKALFSTPPPYLQGIFSECEYPWELLPRIENYTRELIEKGIDGFHRIAPWVLVGEDVKIHRSAVIESPCIIGHGTEIRPFAYIRGSVITGEGCMIGNSSELKNCILLSHAKAPHYNYVGDSILGEGAHLGAGAICSNLKSDGTPVVIRAQKSIPTDRRKVGAFIGDFAEIGCGCVLNPGTVIGKKSAVYPLTSLRGVYPCNAIIKSTTDVVKRRT